MLLRQGNRYRSFPKRLVVYTLGYSTLSLEEFLELLGSLGVSAVVDVRRWTMSVKRPEFSSERLAETLRKAGMSYLWLPELGGYRRFGVDVEDIGIATCFKSEGFRAYATYLVTSEAAQRALETLERAITQGTVAVVCKERWPFACHRKIVADWLTARGMRVLHAVPPRLFEHKLSKCAIIDGRRLRYV